MKELDLHSGSVIAIKMSTGHLPIDIIDKKNAVGIDYATSDATEIAIKSVLANAIINDTSYTFDSAVCLDTRRAADTATRPATSHAASDAISRAIWSIVGITRGAVDSATKAIKTATKIATHDAIWNAVNHSTWNSTTEYFFSNDLFGDSIINAIWHATHNSTWDPVLNAPSNNTTILNYDGTAIDQVVANFMLLSLKHWSRGLQWGAHWSGLSAFYDFFETVAKIPIGKNIRAWNSLAMVSAQRYLAEDFAIICDRPVVLKIENRRNRDVLHCTTGPAIAWQTGRAIYAVHGIIVPAEAIEKGVTLSMIEIENNAEVARVLVELYENGEEGKYLRDSGAEILDERHSDRGPWRLLRKQLKNGQTYLGVDVPNSTNEPDGSIRRYTIRVHPEARPMLNDGTLGERQVLNVQNAVASTFGLKGSEYSPSFES